MMNIDNDAKDGMVASTMNKEIVFVLPSSVQISPTQVSTVISGSFQFTVDCGGNNGTTTIGVTPRKKRIVKGTKEPRKTLPVKKKRNIKKKDIQDEDNEDCHKLTKELRADLKRQIEEYRLEKIDAAV
jgi:hypothetical protein